MDLPLLGQVMPRKVPLHKWIANQQLVESNKDMLKVYNLLHKHGKYFPNKVLDSVTVESLPDPTRVENRKCHSNTILYACVLNEDYPRLSRDFNFVSGVYGLKATAAEIPEEKRYDIYHHSFFTYKGFILDWTKIYYPPNGYKVDQYFGIAYSIPVVVNTMNDVIDRNDDVLVPLIPLLKKPFLN